MNNISKNKELSTKIDFNSINFEIDETKGLINLTEMAKPFGKKVAHFLELPKVIEFIDNLVSMSANPILKENVIITVHGGNKTGTWACKQIAIKFGAWLDPKFEVFCMNKLEELFTKGTTSIKPLSNLQMLQIQLNELIRVEQEQALMKEQINEHEDKINLHEDKLSIHDSKISKIEEQLNLEEDFFTIKGYAKKFTIMVKHKNDYSPLGTKASKLSKVMGYKVNKIDHPEHGTVGSYHITVLQNVFEEYQKKNQEEQK